VKGTDVNPTTIDIYDHDHEGPWLVMGEFKKNEDFSFSENNLNIK
jgi:hypothetical protein